MRKNVLITGASSGLGKEIANIYLHKGNYNLILNGKNTKSFDIFKNEKNVSIIIGDLTNNKTLDAIENEIRVFFMGHVDILINNAGIIYIKPFEEITSIELDNLLNIDLKAHILLTQRIYPFMVSQKSGHIINVNSTSGKEARANHTMYNAAKFGLTGFTNALRIEARKFNIRVTGFHPGGMNTDFYDNMKNVPIETYMDPKKIAEILVFLTEIDPSIAPDEILLNRMVK